ncbi:MAG: sodium:glutamate symporter, partial [Roseburia sp.]|nr:sodium:glutamate symporter [Roseburia sp.]
MYSIVIAFGIASVMLCFGMFLRGKCKPFQRMLMPVSVIGGVLGLLFVNLILTRVNIGGVTVKDFSSIVDVFFTMSFISIGLTGGKKKSKKAPKEEKKKAGGSASGAMGMALIWCMLYAITPVAGILIVSLIGGAFDMEPMYGILIPFAFCQGPGQSSTYGKLFENTYGFENAEMVALTFAVCGFLAAFLVGVPLARYGLKKGLARNKSKINEAVERGYFVPEEQREALGKTTFHSANIETVAAHF